MKTGLFGLQKPMYDIKITTGVMEHGGGTVMLQGPPSSKTEKKYRQNYVEIV